MQNIEFTSDGNILFINQTTNVSKKENTVFNTRTFGIDATEKFHGRSYPNAIGFQVKQENCELLDRFNIGDRVRTTFVVEGSYKDNPDKEGSEKNPKATTIFTNLSAYKIERIDSAGNIITEEQYQSSKNAPAGNNAPPPPTPTPIPEGKDDLPF